MSSTGFFCCNDLRLFRPTQTLRWTSYPYQIALQCRTVYNLLYGRSSASVTAVCRSRAAIVGFPHTRAATCSFCPEIIQTYLWFCLTDLFCKQTQRQIVTVLLASFLPRDATHSADYAVTRCLSFRPSVRPSHAGILSKRLYAPSNFFHHLVATPLFQFFLTKRYGNIPTETPPTDVSNAR